VFSPFRYQATMVRTANECRRSWIRGWLDDVAPIPAFTNKRLKRVLDVAVPGPLSGSRDEEARRLWRWLQPIAEVRVVGQHLHGTVMQW